MASASYKEVAQLVEILKDCRVTCIETNVSVEGIMSWRITYVYDQDMGFSTLDDEERAIRSKNARLRSLTTFVSGDEKQTIEAEWI